MEEIRPSWISRTALCTDSEELLLQPTRQRRSHRHAQNRAPSYSARGGGGVFSVTGGRRAIRLASPTSLSTLCFPVRTSTSEESVVRAMKASLNTSRVMTFPDGPCSPVPVRTFQTSTVHQDVSSDASSPRITANAFRRRHFRVWNRRHALHVRHSFGRMKGQLLVARRQAEQLLQRSLPDTVYGLGTGHPAHPDRPMPIQGIFIVLPSFEHSAVCYGDEELS